MNPFRRDVAANQPKQTSRPTAAARRRAPPIGDRAYSCSRPDRVAVARDYATARTFLARAARPTRASAATVTSSESC